MTGKERILKTLKGEKADRAPIWIMDTVTNDDFFDDFTDSWMKEDQRFIELKKYYYGHSEIFIEYKQINPVCNRTLATPPKNIRVLGERYEGNCKLIEKEIITPKGNLRFIDKLQRNVSTEWRAEYPVKCIEDAEKLLSVDFELEDMDFSSFYRVQEKLGDRGAMIVLINTPMVTVSSSMPFEDFLIYTATDYEMIKEMTEVAFIRVKTILEKCIKAGLGPIFRLMGSEQATPPMNRLKVYEELVYNYEKQLIDMIHKSGSFAAVHCHGKVREVLPYMVDAGVDMLDPVEAPPSGDVEFSEAKRIVDGKITLAGNIQYDDLERNSPDEIRRQIYNLFADGRKDHVIVSCTGYPITYMSQSMLDNYKSLIDASIEYGAY